jgi:hypothetical protein
VRQGEVVVDYGCLLATDPVITVTNSATIVNISRHIVNTVDVNSLAAYSWRPANASPSTTTTASYPVSGSLLTWKIVAIALRPMN